MSGMVPQALSDICSPPSFRLIRSPINKKSRREKKRKHSKPSPEDGFRPCSFVLTPPTDQRRHAMHAQDRRAPKGAMFRGLERLASHGLPAAEAIAEAEPTSRAAAHTSNTKRTCWPSLTRCRVPALVLRAVHVAVLPLVAGTTTASKTPRSCPHLTFRSGVTPFLTQGCCS